MHLLKIIHGYPPLYNAGSEVYSQSLCDALQGQGHQITVFTREEDPYRLDFELRREERGGGQVIYYVNMPRDKDGYRHRQVDEALARVIAQDPPDIAHIGHLNHLSTGLPQVLKQSGIPIVFTLHDFWLMCPRGQFLQRNSDGEQNHSLCTGQEDKKCALNCYRMYFSGLEDFATQDLAYWTNWVGRRMEETRQLAALVDCFIAPSQYLRQRFLTDFGLNEEKVLYLDYGFPTHYLQATRKSPEKELFTFGYIGTHIPAKGVNLLIEAFRKLKGRAELKIWGWKDAQSQKALLEMTRESENPIHFCGGYINKNLADEVFSRIDAIVVPSIWGENSPLVIHEAQACRIPVITADFGGMSEYVRQGVNGLLFEHRNPDALSQQMQWALNHPKELENMGKRGYLYSPQGAVPDIKAHTAILLNLYTQLIHDRNTKPILARDY